MTEQIVSGPAPGAIMSPLRLHYFVAAALALTLMTLVIAVGSDWWLNFLHVLAGSLWTGIDLFMGFVIGPIIRRMSFETRRAMISAIVPRTLVLMPTLSIVTTTAGWYLAKRMGFLEIPYPQYYWVLAALVIVSILTVQGLGILLPTNLRLYFEMQKAAPDFERIGRWMRIYVYVVAFQGMMQVAIYVVMARMTTGL